MRNSLFLSNSVINWLNFYRVHPERMESGEFLNDGWADESPQQGERDRALSKIQEAIKVIRV